MSYKNTLVYEEDFWRNKKIVVVLNLADESVYTDVLRRSHSKEAGKERKRCIRAALKIQNFLDCPVDNLVAIIVNQGEYKPSGWFNTKEDIRWHLLSFHDAGAIRIE
jgi:hypothetical protein